MSDGGRLRGDGGRRRGAHVDLVVITGYSGAGKSEAIAAFEDGGYFCVDNLPPRMIGSLGELFRHEGSGVRARRDRLRRARRRVLRGACRGARPARRRRGSTPRCSSWRPTRRRSSTASRRRAAAIRWRPNGRVLEGIRAEREVLGPLRERADVVMDTSDLTGAMLRRRVVTELLGPKGARGKLAADDHHLRIQERPAARSRPRARRPLPAQPALPRGSAPPDRARPRRWSSTSRPATSRAEFYDAAVPAAGLRPARLRHRGQDPSDDRDRLHRRGAIDR